MKTGSSYVLGALAWVLVCATTAQVGAQTFPQRPIKVVVPFGPGSAVDVIPRIILEQMAVGLGQPLIVENRAGAGGTIGMSAVAKADPDGYTLLVNSSAHTIVPSVYKSLSIDVTRDLVGVAMLGNLPQVMITATSKGFKTANDLVAAAQAKPGSFNFSTAGVGTATHLAAEKFRLAAGFDARHVPFKSGSEALTEIITGRVEYYFCPIGTALPAINDGRIVGLAVSPPKRTLSLPNVPTTVELGYPGSDYMFWVGMFAPANTPQVVIDKLHAEAMKAIAHPRVKERLANNAMEPLSMSPAELDKFVAAELPVNAKLVQALGLGGK
jgi:tripartite-type tricarboxylate transporter receptor subunit TctC